MGTFYPDPLKNKLYLGCLFFLEIGCFTLSSSLYAKPTGTALSISQQREQAVQLAKQGKLPQAIATLQQLHRQAPKDLKVTADLIVLLRLAGKNQAIAQLTQTGQLQQQALQLPAYVRMAWIGGLRDSQQPKLAYQVAQQIMAHQSLSNQAPQLDVLYYATLAAEAGQSTDARATLDRIQPATLKTADQYAQLAYIYRLLGDAGQGLTYADQSLAIQPSHKLALTQKRLLLGQQAVKLASQRQFEPAISQLYQLHQQNPDDLKTTADLMVVLRLAGRNAELVRLAQQEKLTTKINDIPAYAYKSWLDALRDQQQFQAAFELARQIYNQSEQQPTGQAPFDPWYYATLAAEAGQTAVVQQLLGSLQQGTLNADQYAQLAYIQRLAGLSGQAVVSSQQALALNPQQRLALEQQFVALRNLDRVTEAYQLAQQHPEVFPASAVWLVKADILSLNMQAALKQKDQLELQGKYQQAAQLIDQNLLALRQALDQLNKNQNEYAPLFNDYLYALRVRERMPELIAEYQQLSVSEQFQLQPYAKRAVADAYLATKQPVQAHEIYQYLLENLPQPDAELFIADYYALIEQEKYQQASDVLVKLDQQFPTMAASMTDLEARKTRVRVEQMLALDAAYRNQLDIAVPKLQQLVQDNPDNTSLANDYATILNWRGLPQAAEQVVQQAYENAPHSVTLDLTHASNARDLQDYAGWQDALEKASQKTPESSSVIKAQQEWQDRQRVTLQSDLKIAHSKADARTLSSVNGSHDREWHTRLNSPWLDNRWRIFVDHQDRWADLEPAHQRDQRLGLGAEWQQDRKNAWVLVNQQLDNHSGQSQSGQSSNSQKTGFSAGWGHWLNDHWRYRLGYEHNSAQIPLRALEAGLDANGYQAGVDWRQHESRSASFSYQALDISDGNLRQSVSGAFNQRLFANEKHITTGGLEAFYENNSQPGGSYFNPDHNLSYGINLDHDWMTWRGDEQQSFNQHFELGTGINQQAGFSGKAYVNALYQHEWQLNRRWQINYGIGWGSQVYDGNREQRTYGVLGLSGAF
ncbi:poly-beta-1,6 N-acetyl-D-glucosamine export porin PgaA [Alkanindiges illinoisensis]|uniref:poly-beta-1,6 N-acetyl-D-glucosamine export porin PgaA n=1 Tax=Alkanindiges illinoisensis TaxID=197183 RepID=UPI000478E1FE|nr:poly-beta-1,6 N-acetyl-D-glucosamine export porin PgaA [Alkanindiges illinoisensis]